MAGGHVREDGFSRVGRAALAVLALFAAQAVSFGLLTHAARAADRVYGGSGSEIAYANLDGSGGGRLDTGAATVDDPEGIAIDAARGRIYWANCACSGGIRPASISFANLDGSGGGDLDTTGATLDRPKALTIDPASGRVWWVNSEGGRISFANLDGGGGGDLDTTGATVNPQGLALEPATGRMWWINGGAGPISFANLDGSGGGDLDTGSATVEDPIGVAINAARRRIYWANYTPSVISFANLDGSASSDLDSTGASGRSPRGLAIDADAGRLYWAYGTGFGHRISFTNLDGGGGDLSTPDADINEFLALLEAPSGAGAPTVTGGATTGTTLSCSNGGWAPDQLGAFLYRAPRAFSFQWTRDGVAIPGATARVLTASSPGEYRCTVTASNDAGARSQTSAPHAVSPPQQEPQPSPPNGGSGPDRTPPVISRASLSHRGFRVGRRPTAKAAAKRRRAPAGTRIRFTLSEPAAVRLRIERRLPGRRARRHGKRRCVTPTHRLRHHRRCVRHRRAGTLTRTRPAGRTRLAFSGRIGHRRLHPGRYRLRISATDAAGNRSRTTTLRFRIVARHRQRHPHSHTTREEEMSR